MKFFSLESKIELNTDMLDLEMLSQNTKQDSYEKCDKRLTNFIDALTSKAKGETIDCTSIIMPMIIC